MHSSDKKDQDPDKTSTTSIHKNLGTTPTDKDIQSSEISESKDIILTDEDKKDAASYLKRHYRVWKPEVISKEESKGVDPGKIHRFEFADGIEKNTTSITFSTRYNPRPGAEPPKSIVNPAVENSLIKYLAEQMRLERVNQPKLQELKNEDSEMQKRKSNTDKIEIKDEDVQYGIDYINNRSKLDPDFILLRLQMDSSAQFTGLEFAAGIKPIQKSDLKRTNDDKIEITVRSNFGDQEYKGKISNAELNTYIQQQKLNLSKGKDISPNEPSPPKDEGPPGGVALR